MQFKLDTKITPADFNIKHGDGIVMLGSCFSDNMSSFFENSGFNVSSNPIGTLFHPLPIEFLISQSINELDDFSSLERDGIHFSWDESSKIYAESKEGVRSKILEVKKQLRKDLLEAELLVITFGSSWGYSNLTRDVVANCHKMPSNLFNKELSDLKTMKDRWSKTLAELLKLNPELSIVFTVSPVRHKKDGLVENNRSKARLIELAHDLAIEFGIYFPSYEIVIDELRDYRFYKNDLVHPSDDAISYVWNKFKDFVFLDETQKLMKEVANVNSTLAHRSLHPNQKADLDRIEKANAKKDGLNEECGTIYWK